MIEQFCRANGQLLLPLVNLIQSASQVVETVIHEIGAQTLEMILVLECRGNCRAAPPGKARREVQHHGLQPGHIRLADRKVKLKQPCLRHKIVTLLGTRPVERRPGPIAGPRWSSRFFENTIG